MKLKIAELQHRWWAVSQRNGILLILCPNVSFLSNFIYHRFRVPGGWWSWWNAVLFCPCGGLEGSFLGFVPTKYRLSFIIHQSPPPPKLDWKLGGGTFIFWRIITTRAILFFATSHHCPEGILSACVPVNQRKYSTLSLGTIWSRMSCLDGIDIGAKRKKEKKRKPLVAKGKMKL